MLDQLPLVIFSGRGNPALTERICDYLQIPQGEVRLFTFSDGETGCQIDENVRGGDVFVVQSTCPPVNDTVMELLIMLDACRRSSASRVTAVLPYFGYARQDRKDRPRVPITAKLVSDLLTAAGASRILTMDLHAGQIQGFFNIPVDHLFAAPVLIDELKRMDLPDLVLVSPDAGGVERARAFAKRLHAGLAIVDKRRTSPNHAHRLLCTRRWARAHLRDRRRHHRHRRDAGEDRTSVGRSRRHPDLCHGRPPGSLRARPGAYRRVAN